MIELTFLALINRLMNWGLTPLIATRTVAADPAAVQRLLADPSLQLVLLRPRARFAVAHLRTSASGRVISLELLRRGRTVLWLTWILSAGRGTTEVDLAVQFETRGVATRLALVLGGRRRLARRVQAALGRLGRICAHAAEDVAPAPLAPALPTAAPAAAPDCGGRTRKTRAARDANRAQSRPR
jgi:hypothetical protein